MNKSIFVFLLLTSIIGQSQESITKNIGEFSELKIFDKLVVTIKKSTENKVEIFGNRKEEVDVVMKGNQLKIKMSLDNTWEKEKTEVIVYYKSLSKVDVNEGAKVTISETLSAETLDLRAQEGAVIKGTISTDNLSTRVVTGGKLVLNGTAKRQDVTIKAGGQYMSKDLKTEYTTVRISAGGRGNIYATKYVNANTAAGGTIRIYGKPSKIDKKKVFGGRIIEVN